MLRKLLVAGLVTAALSVPATAQVVPESLRQAVKESGPTQRVEAANWLRTTHADLAGELHRELEKAYPDFQLKVWSAASRLQQEQPGLFRGVAVSLIEDLQGEPAEAALDVAQAVLDRYPHFPRRMAELRRQHGPGLAVGELLAGRYPDFRTAFLSRLPSAPGRVRQLLAEDFSDLRRGVALDLSRLVDQRYPELPKQLIEARRSGERPLVWLRDNRPEVLLEAARHIHVQRGERIRELAVTALNQPPRGGLAPVLELVSSRYPQLPDEVWWTRHRARQSLRSAVLAEFPDLPTIVAQTLEEKHPDLLSRAMASLERHHPELRQQIWTALETEMPGLQEKVRSFVGSRYPDLWQQLETRLRT